MTVDMEGAFQIKSQVNKVYRVQCLDNQGRGRPVCTIQSMPETCGLGMSGSQCSSEKQSHLPVYHLPVCCLEIIGLASQLYCKFRYKSKT